MRSGPNDYIMVQYKGEQIVPVSDAVTTAIRASGIRPGVPAPRGERAAGPRKP